MSMYYRPIYKCSLCEQRFDAEPRYVSMKDALNHVPELSKFEPIHECDGRNVGFGVFVGFERIITND